MCRVIFSLLLFMLWTGTQAASEASATAVLTGADVRFAVIKTGQVRTREGLVFSGGSFSKEVVSNFSAFLIKHNNSLFLFESGLGNNIARQYKQDMPLWARPFFRYEEPVVSAQKQLSSASVGPIQRIVLSHSHWDHASGLEDFPDAQIWVSEQEQGYMRQSTSGLGSAWPSQVATKSLRWNKLVFQAKPYEGFEQSLDLFGDGRIVLVPMFGHTPGSVGMFLLASTGKRYFFVGDVVWHASALKDGQPKFWAARRLVDHDSAQTGAMIEKIRAVMRRDFTVVIVPTHDALVQDSLGYFPAWVQ